MSEEVDPQPRRQASKFAFVSERTSSLAGRAAAASFIGDRFRKPAVRRLLYV